MPVSNASKLALMKGEIDFDNDVFKIILMNNSFVFNIDSHDSHALIAANALSSGNGYDAATLSAIGTTDRDDVNDYSEADFNDVLWTATGGSIGPANGAIIYDDSHASKVVLGYVDFGTAQTATDGGAFKIANIKIRTS